MLHNRRLNILLLILLSFLVLQADVNAEERVLKVGGANTSLLSDLSVDGTLHGLFPEVLEEIAGKEKWRIRYVPCQWDNCFEKLERGEIDLLMAVAVTEERKKRFDYNQLTVINNWGQLLISRQGYGQEIDSLVELRGTRVALVKNNIYSEKLQEMLAAYSISANFVLLPSYEAVISALENGEADAGVVNNSVAEAGIEGRDVRGTHIVFAPSELRFMTAKGRNTYVLEAIDNDLRQLMQDKSSGYHTSLRRLAENSRKKVIPAWMKFTLFAASIVFPIVLLNVFLLRKSVERRTEALRQRNHELADMEKQLRLQLATNDRVCSALRISEESYRRLFSDAPFGVIQTRLNGDLILFNPEICRMFGYDNQHQMMAEISNITRCYDDQRQREELIQYVLHTDGYVLWEDVPCRRRDGSLFYISGNMRAVRAANGEVEYLEGFLKEVTKRKQAEDALKHSEQTLRLYVQSLPVASILLDTDCVVRRWNTAAERLFGYTAEEAQGCLIYHLINGPKQSFDHSRWNNILAGEIDTLPVNENVTKDGHTIICEWTNTRFFNSKGELQGIIAIAQDITERRKAEELLIQTEKMMMIGGLAAGMAHEINNPMGIIVQNVQNIERRLSIDLAVNHKVAGEIGIKLEQVCEYLARRDILDFLYKIGRAGIRTSRIVSNMLQFSRRPNPGYQPANLAELLNQSVEMVSRDYDLRKKYDFNNIRIVKVFEQDMPLVPVNVVELEQVMINLLKNSAQALADMSGHINPEIKISLGVKDDRAVISVADNGPGIPEAIRKRLFEPFFTTKDVGSGTGLGLYVSYMLVTKHASGEMSVDSVPGEGTCFTVLLPLQASR